MSMARPPKALLLCLGSVVCGLLLAASYAPLEWQGAAWFALVPLLIVARYCRPSAAFKWGFVAGFVFWMLTLAWLRRLVDKGVPSPFVYAGWIVLAAYCALFMAAFAMLASRWFTARGTDDWRSNVLFVLAAPLLWAGFEYLRSVLFTGFPWNLLGVSQYRNLPICQIAEWGGVYVVSAVLVLFNAGLAMTLLKFRGFAVGRRYRAHPELMVALLVLAFCLSFGVRSAMRVPPGGRARNMRVALIQPNIPQEEKWTPELAQMICDKLYGLTIHAAAPSLDLIVWPETSTPADVLRDDVCREFVEDLLTNGIPILVGSTDTRPAGDGVEYFNSSILLEPSGTEPQVYDKQHLMPFGEYAPMTAMIRIFQRFAPLGWAALSPGKDMTVFKLTKRPDLAFSTLICFEDAFPGLARVAVLKGARLLIDQTNDAWFDISAGSRQHMAHCVFRCIENRVPAVRSANTGISCFMDKIGRITDMLDDRKAGQPAEGFLTSSVSVEPADMPLTFYTRHGDIFAIPCGIIAALCFVLVIAGEWRIKSRLPNS